VKLPRDSFEEFSSKEEEEEEKFKRKTEAKEEWKTLEIG